MRLKRYAFLLAALFTGGCATYHARPLAADKTAADFEARTLADPGFLKYLGKSPTAWGLDDLTLAAFYYHPDLDVARAEWGVAKAGQVTAGERPNPTATANPEYAVNEPPGSSPWVAGLSLDIPIETAGKRGYRIQTSQALSEAARIHIAHVAWQVRSRVRTSLLAFSSAQRNTSILRDQQAKLNENKNLLEGRSKNGFVSPLTLTQAEVLAGKNEVSLQDAQHQMNAARDQLADAVGITAETLQGVSVSTSDFAQVLFADGAALREARSKAMRGRSDLMEALAAYAASQHALQLEIAKQYPDIHLGPGYLFDQGVSRWGLSLVEALPIFNRNKGAIGEAAARREEAAARFTALQDQVIGEIDRAIHDYQAAHKKLEIANRLLETHLKQEKKLRRILQPGDLSRLTLFRSQLDIDSTRLIASDALTQYHQAAGALEDALERPLSGTPSEPLRAESNPRENSHAE